MKSPIGLVSTLFRVALVPTLTLLAGWALRWLSVFIAVGETLSVVLFEILAGVVGMRPSETFQPKESAILIIGAGEGIGRSVTMKFSELGYTVFALCPNRLHNMPTPETRPSDVSALLHAWQHKKKDASNKPWATIVPISLDTLSKHDRARACETVKAYCSSNSLHLVALICIPSAPGHASQPLLTHRSHSPSVPDAPPSTQKFLPLIFAKEEICKDFIAREVLEPILMTQDYVKLLRKSCGRVIVVSGCSQRNFVSGAGSPLNPMRRELCRVLRNELEPLGIRVASVFGGPLLPDVDTPRANVDLDMRSICSKLTDPETLRVSRREIGVWRTIQKAFSLFAVSEDEIFSVMLRIVDSRHPKFNHVVGASALFQSVLDASPLTFQWLVRHLTSET